MYRRLLGIRPQAMEKSGKKFKPFLSKFQDELGNWRQGQVGPGPNGGCLGFGTWCGLERLTETGSLSMPCWMYRRSKWRIKAL